jgi:5-methylcytosine-specific restriction enzyme A
MEFVAGKEDRRGDLHSQFGGNPRSGISVSSQFPIAFLFTGDSGQQYGYHDGFQGDGTFWYTGEGQVGDMKMTRGNLAIRDSAGVGRELHLFEQTRKLTCDTSEKHHTWDITRREVQIRTAASER